MDRTVPSGAAILLDFIGSIEAPKGYDTIYGNNQSKLKIPITSRTVDQLIKAQSDFTRRYGSSAAGRYQFMKATLQGLKADDACQGSDLFAPDLQDHLALCLLRRRGYDEFMAGKINAFDFARRLAMEWASLPVLKACKGAHCQLQRGQSYYAGDALNRALVSPERFSGVIRKAYEAEHAPAPSPVAVDPPAGAPVRPDPTPGKAVAVAGIAAVVAAALTWGEHLLRWLGL